MRRLLWLIAFGVVVQAGAQRWYADGTGDSTCDAAYPDVCIEPPPPDLDCADLRYTSFRVVGADPHGFDADHDGVGCEPHPHRVRR